MEGGGEGGVEGGRRHSQYKLLLTSFYISYSSPLIYDLRSSGPPVPVVSVYSRNFCEARARPTQHTVDSCLSFNNLHLAIGFQDHDLGLGVVTAQLLRDGLCLSFRCFSVYFRGGAGLTQCRIIKIHRANTALYDDMAIILQSARSKMVAR